MKIKFLKNHGAMKAGDVVDLTPYHAERLVKEGFAKFATVADLTRHVLIKPQRLINKLKK